MDEEKGTLVSTIEKKDFYFDDKQYELNDNSSYQVAIEDLSVSTGYPVIHLGTGVYDSNRSVWIWNTYFNPYMGE